MKRTLQILISASASSIMALSALAQDNPNPKTDSPSYTPERASQTQRANQLNGAAKGSEIIGMTVKNNQDEKLGKVEDLAVDVESGRIVQVILSTGGFLGVGDTLTAVPPSALHHDVANKVLHLDTDKEKLKNAPKFESAKWAESSDSEHLSAVYRHYGEEPALTFIQTNGSPNISSSRKPDGTWDKDRISNQDQFMIPTSRLGLVQKGSKVIGTSVKNLQDEKLGKVENILVDLSSGRIVAVIVSTGGFIGIGDELSAVPPTALRYTVDRETLQLDVSKNTLSNSPHFKANQWPDFSEPTYTGGIYRAYNVEPYFVTDATTGIDTTRRNVRDRDDRIEAPKDADNTARNVRDRDDRTLTPTDQGNSKADINTTAQIRKEVVANKAMSVNGKNVKIITNNGQVTLRGPVNSAEEKRIIGEIADRIAQAGNVDNQLEVKATTTRY